MLIVHNKLQLALGLNWSMAQDSAEVRMGSKAMPGAQRVVVPADGRFWLGLYEGQVKGKAYAAALIVGLVVPTCIVCQAVSEEEAWICSIQDGKPVPLYDKLIPIADARNTLIEWTHFFSEAEMVGDQLGAGMTLEDVLAALDQKIADKEIKKKQLQAAMLVRQSVSLAAILKVFLLVALIAGGYLAWTTYQRVRKNADATQQGMAKAAQAALNAQQTEAERQKLIADFRAAVEKKRLEVETSVGRVSSAWSQWEGARRSVPFIAHGYTPVSMDCGLEACNVAWAGTDKYTFAVDKGKVPGAVQDFDTRLATTSRIPVSAPSTDGRPLVQFASAEELSFRMNTDLATVVPGLQIEPAQPVVVSPPPNIGLAPETVGSQGRFRASFQGPAALVHAHEAIARLSRWPVTLTTVRYSAVNSVASVEVEGTYTFFKGR